MTTATATVWDDLVGQRPTIEVLKHAASGIGMTHAWLITGPPGSGRSNVARAFATALQCERRTGCGECEACRLGMSGSQLQTDICNDITCTDGYNPYEPVDCVVSEWTEYSPCTALCSGGLTSRTRTVLSPAELPIGVVTACIGAPFFVLVLRTSREAAA